MANSLKVVGESPRTHVSRRPNCSPLQDSARCDVFTHDSVPLAVRRPGARGNFPIRNRMIPRPPDKMCPVLDVGEPTTCRRRLPSLPRAMDSPSGNNVRMSHTNYPAFVMKGAGRVAWDTLSGWPLNTENPPFLEYCVRHCKHLSRKVGRWRVDAGQARR